MVGRQDANIVVSGADGVRFKFFNGYLPSGERSCDGWSRIGLQDCYPSVMELADLRMLLRLGGLGPIAWLVPPQYWRPLRQRIMSNRAPSGGLLSLMEHVIQRPLTEEQRLALAYQAAAETYEDALRVLRSYRPGRWAPEVELTGEQHLRGALELGKGVILWVADCVGTKIATKLALHNAGYPLFHLSRPTHGFSATPFGIKFLNPHWQRIENRFVAERLVLTPDNNIRIMKRMRQLVGENRIVTVTDVVKAKQRVEAAFLGGYRLFASGPMNLASRCKAAVLPLFCRETAANHFVVTIGENLAPQGCKSMEIVQNYSRALGEFVSEYPHLWLGWQSCMVTKSPTESQT